MKNGYIAPEIDVIDVEIEKGFAGSPIEVPGLGGNHDWAPAFGNQEFGMGER